MSYQKNYEVPLMEERSFGNRLRKVVAFPNSILVRGISERSRRTWLWISSVFYTIGFLICLLGLIPVGIWLTVDNSEVRDKGDFAGGVILIVVGVVGVLAFALWFVDSIYRILTHSATYSGI